MVRQASVAERLEPHGELHAPVPKKRRRSPIWAKSLVGVGALLLVVSTGTYTATKYVSNKIENGVQRADLLGDSVGKPGEAPPPKVTGPLTFLVIGSDSRAGDNSPTGHAAGVDGERSDTIIMAYIPKEMDRAYIISFPRDSFVPIANKSGDGSDGKNKINAAYAFGGAQRLVKTVNNLTGMKIDYPVIVDFSAVRKITDLVGGVDVVVDREAVDGYRFIQGLHPKYPVTNCRDEHGKRHHCLVFKKGPLHLDGQLAEYYVRQRKGLPRGDLDRAQRQQQFMRALMTKVASGDTLTNPSKFSGLITAVMGSLTVDHRMPVLALADSLKGLRTTDLVFMTLPVRGMGNEPGAGSVVYPDMPKVTELFSAMQNGTLDAWILKNQPNDVTHGA